MRMLIKLLDVYFAERSDSKLLGHALVQLSDRMKVLMNVFKNKDGHAFVKFPASKIGDQYRPHIEFININLERDISAVIGDEVSKRFNNGPLPVSASYQKNTTFDSGECPF